MDSNSATKIIRHLKLLSIKTRNPKTQKNIEIIKNNLENAVFDQHLFCLEINKKYLIYKISCLSVQIAKQIAIQHLNKAMQIKHDKLSDWSCKHRNTSKFSDRQNQLYLYNKTVLKLYEDGSMY